LSSIYDNGEAIRYKSMDDLLDEYHVIAYYYHWTEDTIRKLAIDRRKAYFKRIQRQVKAENGDKSMDADDYD
jgi:hypothetical protein